MDTIPAVVQDLGEYLQKNQNNLSPEATWTFISVVKAADVRTQMEQACVEIMETILAIYSTEFLPMIFASVPEADHLKSRHALTQDYITHQSVNGQGALKRNLSPIYSELNEIARLQEQLISSFPQVQAIMGIDPNSLGNTALGFGAGALAVANPLIGVPLLIYRWVNENQKGDLNNAFLKSWWDRFNEFCNRWDRLQANYQPVYEAQYRFIEEKLKNITDAAIPNILSTLDAEGFNLKKVPVTYQMFLNDIKQKYGIQ